MGTVEALLLQLGQHLVDLRVQVRRQVLIASLVLLVDTDIIARQADLFRGLLHVLRRRQLADRQVHCVQLLVLGVVTDIRQRGVFVRGEEGKRLEVGRVYAAGTTVIKHLRLAIGAGDQGRGCSGSRCRCGSSRSSRSLRATFGFLGAFLLRHESSVCVEHLLVVEGHLWLAGLRQEASLRALWSSEVFRVAVPIGQEVVDKLLRRYRLAILQGYRWLEQVLLHRWWQFQSIQHATIGSYRLAVGTGNQGNGSRHSLGRLADQRQVVSKGKRAGGVLVRARGSHR